MRFNAFEAWACQRWILCLNHKATNVGQWVRDIFSTINANVSHGLLVFSRSVALCYISTGSASTYRAVDDGGTVQSASVNLNLPLSKIEFVYFV